MQKSVDTHKLLVTGIAPRNAKEGTVEQISHGSRTPMVHVDSIAYDAIEIPYSDGYVNPWEGASHHQGV